MMKGRSKLRVLSPTAGTNLSETWSPAFLLGFLMVVVVGAALAWVVVAEETATEDPVVVGAVEEAADGEAV